MNNVNISNIAYKIKFIYGDECEKNTVGMVIFSDGTDYFFDVEYKNKMSNEEVEALLLRGAVIFKDGEYYKPTSFNNENVSFGGGAVVDPEANILSVVLGNYQIKYNSADDTLDFLYNGVDEDVSSYITDGLSMYIDANDIATYGSIRDITGNYTVTNNGATITSDNEYLNFVSSESDYIDTNFVPNLTQWSAELYFYFTSVPTVSQIVLTWGTSGNLIRIAYSDSAGGFVIRSNTGNVLIGDVSEFSTLCHLIVTMNDGTITSYVNGVKSVLSTSEAVQTSHSNTLKLGTKYDCSTDFTDMNLKLFRFYDGKVLSDEEALQNYNYVIFSKTLK